MPIRPCGLPSVRNPPDRDRSEGTSCTFSPRFSVPENRPGRNPSSANKLPTGATRSLELGRLKVGTALRTRWAVRHCAISKRRAGRRIRGDRAGGPIEAAQYRMYCKAGPVKIRRAARGVPDLDPGPLSHERNALPPTGAFCPHQPLQVWLVSTISPGFTSWSGGNDGI